MTEPLTAKQVAEMRARAKRIADTPVFWTGHPPVGPGNWTPNQNDVLTAAHIDVPQLCDTIEALRAEIERLKRELEYANHPRTIT